MNHSGDAAEQIVRMSLEGVEVAAKITGSAAKEVAVMLIAALKNKNSNLKLKGAARLTSMLKSGKALEIFSLNQRDLKNFMQGAKEYGIVYSVLRNVKSKDGLCDIMVKADDAPKISRLVERFNFATVDKASIESEIVASKAAKTAAAPDEKTAGAKPGRTASRRAMEDEHGSSSPGNIGEQSAKRTTGPEAPDAGDTDKLLDDLLGTTEGKAEPDKPETAKTEPDKAGKEQTDSRPLAGGGQPPKSRRSAPTSESSSKSARATSSKPSVKAELREITTAKKKREADAPSQDERPADKAKSAAATHKQPQNIRAKTKSKKSKGSR